MIRRRSADSFDVQFFTRKFQLKNEQEGKYNFLLQKDEPDVSAVESVLVDGKPVPFESTESGIQLHVEADAGQSKYIEIVDRPRPIPQAKRSGVTYSFGVLLRRELSEFRDNTLSRHPGMLKVTREVARRLKMTGERTRKT